MKKLHSWAFLTIIHICMMVQMGSWKCKMFRIRLGNDVKSDAIRRLLNVGKSFYDIDNFALNFDFIL